VIELADDERLGMEARAELQIVAEVLVQDLHGDGRAEALVPRAIHRAHAADADERLDHELAGELSTDQVLRRGARARHRGPSVAEQGEGVVLRQRRGSGPRRAQARGRSRARRRRQRPLGGRRVVRMQPKREAVLGGAAERLGEDEQRLEPSGSRDLEDVERGVDRGVEQRHERGRAGSREGHDHRARLLVGELGDEDGQQCIDGVAHGTAIVGARGGFGHTRLKMCPEMSLGSPELPRIPSPRDKSLKIPQKCLHYACGHDLRAA
jgi:hypothetical protein